MATLRTFDVPNLLAWRKFLGLSQAELADRAGLDVSAIAAVEQGRHGVWAPTLVRLAAAFGVSRTVLLHETPEQAWARGWRPPEHEFVAVGVRDMEQQPA